MKLVEAQVRSMRVLVSLITISGVTGFQNALAQDALHVDPAGNVGVGTSSPAGDLHVKGRATNEGAIYFEDPDGSRIWKLRVTATNDRFAIIDNTASTAPFLMDPGAPSGSLRITALGNVGLGTLAPALRLEVEDTTIDGPLVRLQDSDGQCDLGPEPGGGDSLVVSCTSDLRLKKNVRAADTAATLDNLAKIQLFEYEVRATDEAKLGMIAQELRETHPDRVKASEDGILMARLPGTTELLAAVQELDKLVGTLQQRVKTLEAELERSGEIR